MCDLDSQMKMEVSKAITANILYFILKINFEAISKHWADWASFKYVDNILLYTFIDVVTFH